MEGKKSGRGGARRGAGRKRTDNEPRKTITFDLPVGVIARATEQARRKGVTRTELITRAIMAFGDGGE